MKVIILIDSREQTPLDFTSYDCRIERIGLASGDYSIRGFENRIAIERKSEDDLLGSITQGRRRFEAELARLRGHDYRAVVCETTWQRLGHGEYRSRMTPGSCVQSIIGLSVRYQCPFIMAGSRKAAAYYVYHALRHYLKQRQEDLKAAIKQSGIEPVKGKAV